MKPYASMKNWQLRAERMQWGWTQARLAQALGVSTKTVRRWELGEAVPYPYYRRQLSTLFGKTAQEL
ncbi:MAG TPA: helix-turn-helix transcriptional regulator, partial [Ktedonobacteraceae bacterium]|nr:helix-turn-helix transcriptional regulator [Ktedonobacteraceae bacterium]